MNFPHHNFMLCYILGFYADRPIFGGQRRVVHPENKHPVASKVWQLWCIVYEYESFVLGKSCENNAPGALKRVSALFYWVSIMLVCKANGPDNKCIRTIACFKLRVLMRCSILRVLL